MPEAPPVTITILPFTPESIVRLLTSGCRSPAGSYSGSRATSAPTQSPKMSTSRRVPGSAASAGTQAQAIDAATAKP